MLVYGRSMLRPYPREGQSERPHQPRVAHVAAAPQPMTTSRFASSNMTFRPVCIAATVMHSATEWLYPASMLALGCLRLRTHSIQFRMLAVVDESAPVLAAVSVGATCDSFMGDSWFAFIPIPAATRSVSPPVGVISLVSRLSIPAFE